MLAASAIVGVGLVSGAGGGSELTSLQSLEARASDRLERALSHAEFDLDDPGAVDRLFDDLRGDPPDVMVNAAAFLSTPNPRTTSMGIRSSPMEKWIRDLAVWAPQ